MSQPADGLANTPETPARTAPRQHRPADRAAPARVATAAPGAQPSQRNRDRFVGFAFAGARCRLTPDDVGALVGTSLLDHVAPTDRKYVSVLLNRVVEKTRIKPARVVFQGFDGHRFPALLGGCRLESCPGSLFLTVLLASGQRAVGETLPIAGRASGQLLDSHTFTAILEDRIVQAREKGLDNGLTLLLVEGLQSMVESMPDGAAAEVRQGIDAYLRGISADGDSAGQLAADRFGIVHTSDIDSDEVQTHIADIIKEAGGELNGGIRSWSLDMAESRLDAADAARALVYTVQAFASAQGGEFTISSLEDGAQRMLSDAVDRIGRLRATIEKRDFFVVYQPIVDLKSEEVHHLEALTRVEGMPSPADFITFAEDVGLIYDFDLLLTQSVLDTLKAYHKEPKLPDVAINLSAKTLMSPLFLRQFQAVTEPYGDLSKKLLLEVTETVVVTDIAKLNEILQKLRSAGFRICLDDVGAGSTSFQSLYGLQVDYAKIDGRFVRGAAGSTRDMAMLRSMVDVCHQLGLQLIGEQVEEPDHARLLDELNVPLAQGFLYGRPSRDFAYFAKDWSKMAKKGGKVLWK